MAEKNKSKGTIKHYTATYLDGHTEELYTVLSVQIRFANALLGVDLTKISSLTWSISLAFCARGERMGAARDLKGMDFIDAAMGWADELIALDVESEGLTAADALEALKEEGPTT